MGTLAILATLYHLLDWRQVASSLWMVDPLWLAGALLLFVPQTFVSAWRWHQLANVQQPLTLAAALRQTLAASALNLFVPGKLGDLSKGAMLVAGHPEASRLRKSAGVLVLFEKGTDVGALLVMLLLGWAGIAGHPRLGLWLAALVPLGLLIAKAWRPSKPDSSQILSPPQSVRELVSQLTGVGCLSLLLWGLHLAQFHLFLQAAGAGTSWMDCLARVPTAIFAGLVPVSMCGIGPRDATLVWQFREVAPTSAVAVVGLLSALRYLVPGAVGLWFLPGVWKKSVESDTPHWAASSLPLAVGE